MSHVHPVRLMHSPRAGKDPSTGPQELALLRGKQAARTHTARHTLAQEAYTRIRQADEARSAVIEVE